MSRLIVVGVGTEKEHLTMGAVAALRSGATVVLHTQRCGAAEWLCEQGIPFNRWMNSMSARKILMRIA